ncbi:MAG TPA: S-adenosylmethionine:tRNA ribosyltransferase-isomerase [Lacibacter sp.]|nr:S-adenosylmethionine:tRNA ribosyltransferase-isomerase [Lacibacter sp.]
MAHPQTIAIKDYTYELPQERIAKYPLPERDLSKLLIYKNGNINETTYRNIVEEFVPGTLLVFNNTKVIEARIFFQKSTGSVIEIFCLEPGYGMELTQAMTSKGKVVWNCLIGGAGKWKQPVLEKQIKIGDHTIVLSAQIKERLPDCFVIEFSWNDDYAFGEVLHYAGVIPLPPYLHRNAEQADYERYQTVYAKNEGSVAAPTAGLHFTPQLLDALEKKGVQTEQVTLHVGAGTFKPVKSETIAEHEMHKEWIQVNLSTIERIINGKFDCIVPVGTTSFRTLESLYWMGVKAINNPSASIEELEIKQWDAYDLTGIYTPRESLTALINWMKRHQLEQLICHTQLLAAPGYVPKVTDAIITNFHQPNSTLLLLVASLIGTDWRRVYEYAFNHDFRFLSYGDGSLLWVTKQQGVR